MVSFAIRILHTRRWWRIYRRVSIYSVEWKCLFQLPLAFFPCVATFQNDIQKKKKYLLSLDKSQ